MGQDWRHTIQYTSHPQSSPLNGCLEDDCLTPSHLTRLEKNSFHSSQSRTVPLSFYQNVVTSSYTMSYWNWSRWETEIDWMALHGVNLPLALRGEEYIWTKVYKELGIKFEDLEDFFTGPSFLAWGRMGNIQGYGGPLPWSYIESQSKLQLKIVERMRSFGMTPIFSGFAGFVPRAFAAKYPQVNVKQSSNWCEFPERYCCVLILDPTDPFFIRIGSLFLKFQRQVYGFDKVGFYAVDVFNEMMPVQSDPSYLKKTSEAVYSVLKSVESSPIWIMQAWLFYSDREFWKQDQIKVICLRLMILMSDHEGCVIRSAIWSSSVVGSICRETSTMEENRGVLWTSIHLV